MNNSGTNDKTTVLNILIREKYEYLGSKEKLIADYILSHEDEVLSIPIADLASRSGVSQPTAVRFCKKLGFNGIKEFKIYCGTIKGSGRNIEPCTFNDDDDIIFKKVFKASMSAIERSFKSTSLDTIQKVADYIYSADIMLVFGVGGSKIPAEFLTGELTRFGKKVFAYTELFSLKQFNADFSNKDLAFFVSRSGETEDIIRLAKKAKEDGADVIALTTNPDSSLYDISDEAIIVNEELLMEGDKNSFSRIGAIALISCLYIMCATRKAKEDPLFKENYLGLTNYK